MTVEAEADVRREDLAPAPGVVLINYSSAVNHRQVNETNSRL